MRVRRLIFCLVYFGAGLFVGHGAHGAVATSADEASRHQRIQDALRRGLAAYHSRDIAACHALAREMRADMQADWSRDVFWLWASLSSCDYRPGGPLEKSNPQAVQVIAAFEDVLAHFAAMPREQRLAHDHYVGVKYRIWSLLRQLGLPAQADELEEAEISALLAQLQTNPQDELALAGLRMLGAELYGTQLRNTFLESFQQRLAQALGPGHVATLAVLRARIFAMRQLERPQEALDLTDEFARLVQQHQGGNERLMMGNRSERVGALGGLGRFADARDEGLALLHYLQQQTLRPFANLMRSAYNLAGLHAEMADYDGAVAYAQMSIDEGMQTPSLVDRNEVVWARVLLAQAHALRGDAGAVAALHRELAAVQSHALNTAAVAHTLWQAAAEPGAQDARSWARELIGRVVAQTSITLQPARAVPLVLDAAVLPAGAPQGLHLASQAVAQALTGEEEGTQVLAQFALARHAAPLQAQGAAWAYKRAAVGLLRLRQGLPESASVAAQALLAGHEAELRAYIGLLIDSGRLAEAQQALEVLREEELHEFRRRSRGAALRAGAQGGRGLSYTAEEQRRNAAMTQVSATLRAETVKARERADRHANWADRHSTPDPLADAALAHAAQAVQALATQAPASAQGTRPQSLQESSATRPLAAGHARISWLVQPHALQAVVQRGARLQHIALPVPATALNRTVQALRAQLLKPDAAVPAVAQQLHQWLMAPLAAHLRGVKHLHLVPDGALRYVPFAALHDGQRYLAQRYSMSMELGVSVTTATAAALPRAGGKPFTLAAFGRTLPDAQHSALPGVRDELAALQGLRGATVHQGLDAGFTASTLTQALSQRPDVVHLASHFVLDAAGEENSYLLLGDGGRMPLRELRQLPWQGVRVALLSACDTALAAQASAAPGSGKEWAGFAGALHAAGVPNVLATLWRIDDAAAAQWMQQFYAPWRLARGGGAALNAGHLAHTQRQWLRRHQGGVLAHPYYWAAYQWMGEPG